MRQSSTTDAMIGEEATAPMILFKESTPMNSLHDRNKETASLKAISAYFFVTFGGVLMSNFQQLPASSILLWVGLGVILLMRLSRPETWEMFVLHCIFALVLGSLFDGPQFRLLLAEFAYAVIVLQGIWLVWFIRSFPRTDTLGQKAFYGSLYSLCTCFQLLSMLFIFKGFHSTPIHPSLYFALASCLFFAYASWLGSNIKGQRGDNKRQSMFSCSSGSSERPHFWLHALMVVALHAPTAFSLHSFASRWMSSDSGTDATLFLLDATHFCFASALYLQVVFLAPIRLYVQPDASILVETLGRTHAYYKALRAYEGSVEDTPDGTGRCHVYCEDSMRVIVVELTGGRFLYLTPKFPDYFLRAVTQALEHRGKEDLEQGCHKLPVH